MTTEPTDISLRAIDKSSLATLIIELNIARRNSSAYPKGHPVIASSLAKVLRVYEELLQEQSELILGVTSDALMVGGKIFDKSNLVYRDFSRVLFEHGIGALIFQKGVTVEELNNFTNILGLKREQIFKDGGIEEVWNKAGILAISVKPIRYDLFQTTETDSLSVDSSSPSEGLWDRFARELTTGNMTTDGSKVTQLDPEIVAEVLNKKYECGGIDNPELLSAMADFITPQNSDLSQVDSLNTQPYQKLGTFISNLTPELRRQFFNSSFADTKQDRVVATENILSNLSDKTIVETLEDISLHRLTISPVVFGLLQRLGKNSTSPRRILENISEDDQLSQKMKTIFREHASEEFVPDDYQQKLNYIISTDKIPQFNMEEVTELLNTLNSKDIENSISQILLNLIREGVETPEERELLLQNLSDMFGFFLQTGEYSQLHKMIDQLNDNTFPIEIKYRLRDEYGKREFLEEILDGLTIWGKPRFNDIRKIIFKFGSQFTEAILDRLSEEKSMSLRRFYMDCLIELGSVTRIPIINRLYDTRWYFLRNLLIILAAQNDPSIIPLIRPLLHSNDQRLRHEVLKTLLHLRDPQAEKQIMDDLQSQNIELQNAAIVLAEQCKSAAVATKLIALLLQGGYSQSESERKSTIVHTLGEIGRAEILPELAKILSSRSLFHSQQLTKLKSEIIRSLPKYPPTVSVPILEHISECSNELSRLATDTAKSIRNKI